MNNPPQNREDTVLVEPPREVPIVLDRLRGQSERLQHAVSRLLSRLEPVLAETRDLSNNKPVTPPRNLVASSLAMSIQAVTDEIESTVTALETATERVQI